MEVVGQWLISSLDVVDKGGKYRVTLVTSHTVVPLKKVLVLLVLQTGKEDWASRRGMCHAVWKQKVGRARRLGF